METALVTSGHDFHDVHLGDRVRAQFGDQYYGGITISMFGSHLRPMNAKLLS